MELLYGMARMLLFWKEVSREGFSAEVPGDTGSKTQCLMLLNPTTTKAGWGKDPGLPPE